MALLDELVGTDQYDDYKDKINAAIQTINLIGGGSAGDVLAKDDNSDFGFIWVAPTVSPITFLPPVEIGIWNMDTTSSLSVAHGVADFTKIKTWQISIYNDDGTKIYDFLGTLCAVGGDPVGRSGYLAEINSASFSLVRVTSADGGFFDSTSFDDGTMNRGYITMGVSE